MFIPSAILTSFFNKKICSCSLQILKVKIQFSPFKPYSANQKYLTPKESKAESKCKVCIHKFFHRSSPVTFFSYYAIGFIVCQYNPFHIVF